MSETNFVIYSNMEEVFIVTKKNEAKFIRRATKEWKLNLDPDDGDFDREEKSDICVQITRRRGFIVE